MTSHSGGAWLAQSLQGLALSLSPIISRMSISLLIGIVVGAYAAYRLLEMWNAVRARGGNIAVELGRALSNATPAQTTPLEDVSRHLRGAGLEMCNLIVAVDFTLSNKQTGLATFGGKCLHHLSDSEDGLRNPYEMALIDVIQTLAPFDSDRKIPGYAFGCARTGDHCTELFTDGEVDCSTSVKPMLDAYRNAVRTRELSGPTSFASVINEAAAQAKEARTFHVLLIICDGGVSRECLADTCNAIARASHEAPLGIVIVGVGDGPWDLMKSLDEGVTNAAFDNVHFVQHELAFRKGGHGGFAAEALKEVPVQYSAAADRGLFHRSGVARHRRTASTMGSLSRR